MVAVEAVAVDGEAVDAATTAGAEAEAGIAAEIAAEDVRDIYKSEGPRREGGPFSFPRARWGGAGDSAAGVAASGAGVSARLRGNRLGI